jgi:GNAT superfamily N-acetyltransferase
MSELTTETRPTVAQAGAPAIAAAAAPGTPATGEQTPDTQGWHVRAAAHGDVLEVAAAVRALLLELGGRPCAQAEMEQATTALIDAPWEGSVMVAQAGEELVGVLAASWQMAIHTPGRYALIQDLWVAPAWRGHAVGAGLLSAFVDLARMRGMRRVEVGLPKEAFERFAATEAFYVRNGFAHNGPRMRRALA